MLKHAQDNKYAVPAFSFDNLEILKAIINGAQEENSPVIIMASASAINKATVPVVLHLNHCFDLQFIKTKVTSYFGSVMLDWSKYSLKESIEKTKEIVQFAAPLGIAFESQIGHLGAKDDANIYTNIDEAVLFINHTIILML